MSQQPGSEPLTAYVIMRPADGSSSLGTPITAETIESLQPSPEALTAVRAALSARGFTLGPFVGISFAITAPGERFQEMFEPLSASDDGSQELSPVGLDDELRSAVEAVVFEGEAGLFERGLFEPE